MSRYINTMSSAIVETDSSDKMTYAVIYGDNLDYNAQMDLKDFKFDELKALNHNENLYKY